MREILRAAVSFRQPHPLAGDTQMPLRGAGGVSAHGTFPDRVPDARRDNARSLAVPTPRDVAARVLQQGHEVVGRMPDRGGLEIDDAGPARTGAVRQPN
jgi:hypothetical protein